MSDTLFEVTYEGTWPPRILPDDTARTRRTDPLSSHKAGDRSQTSRSRVRAAVLTLIGSYGPQTGNDLNDLYRQYRPHHGWPTVSYDSPRKRAGELARDRELVVTNADDPRGTPHLYALAVKR